MHVRLNTIDDGPHSHTLAHTQRAMAMAATIDNENVLSENRTAFQFIVFSVCSYGQLMCEGKTKKARREEKRTNENQWRNALTWNCCRRGCCGRISFITKAYQ